MRTEPFLCRALRWRPRRLSGLPLFCLLIAAPLHGAPAAPPAPAPLPALALLQEGGSPGQVLTGDHTIARDENVQDVVVVGGTLRVEGKVSGDAIVIGGDLILEENGLVEGNAVVTGGRLLQQGGRVRGEMRILDAGGSDLSREIKRAVLEETGLSVDTARSGGDLDYAARAARETARLPRGTRAESSWFGPIRRGVGDIASTLALGLVLAGMGSALIFYGRRYLATASDTLRTSPKRALGVGVAAAFLIVPTFVVVLVFLAVTIIGIPLLLLAIPLYPLLVAAAITFGLLTTAHALGEYTAEQRNQRFDLRYRNSYAYLFTGLALLLTPFLVSHVLEMTGILSLLGTLLMVLAWTGMLLASTAGLGAVLLSRLGTRRTFIAPETDVDLETDPLFDNEPSTRSPHA